MALPSSGAISLSQVRTEIGLTGAISLNTSQVRTLAGKASGTISMSDLRGKSWEVKYVNSTNRTNASIHALMGSPTVARVYVFENTATISAGTGSYALRTGTFPAGSTLKIINKGTIRGRGGKGGAYNANGAAGGTALYIDMNCTLDNAGGTISGGGGGGGGGTVTYGTIYMRVPGGGGAGSNAGGTGGSSTASFSSGFTTRQPASGTTTGGGVGGRFVISTSSSTLTAGSGGARGAAGGKSTWTQGTSTFSFTGRSGGAAGSAIARNGKTVTIVNAGTRHGATS